MTEPTSNDPGTFSFPYRVDNVKDCILATEKDLREIIDRIMSENFGSVWMSKPSGFKEAEILEIEKRMREEEKRFSNQRLSDRYLDYCYIHDLKNILERNWQVFGQIFPSKERTIAMLDILASIRNPIMHARSDVLIHQQFLCLGISGEFQMIVNRWRLGFKSKVKSFELYFKFGILQGDDDEEAVIRRQSHESINKWLEKIGSDPTTKIEDQGAADGVLQKWVVRTTQGNLKMQLLDEIWHAQYNDQNFLHSTVRLQGDSASAIDKVVHEGGHPYWIMKLALNSNLDLDIIKSKTEEALGSAEWAIGGEYEGNRMIYHSIGDIVDKFNDMTISFTIYSGRDNSQSLIQLVCDGGPDKGFYQAHKLLTVPDILSIVRGEMSPIRKHQLMVKACSHST